MSYLRTKENDADVISFVNAIEDPVQKEDCLELIPMLENISGFKAKMWGKHMVGFGNYTNKTKAGKSGEWFLTGFAPTKSNTSLHLMYALEKETERLSRLGKHKIGKGCLYIKRLSDVDMDVLDRIMKNTFKAMKKATE